MKHCWNRKCSCRNFRQEAVRKEGFLYLHRLTCPVCKTVWYEGLREDDVQVANAEEPQAFAETKEETL